MLSLKILTGVDTLIAVVGHLEYWVCWDYLAPPSSSCYGSFVRRDSKCASPGSNTNTLVGLALAPLLEQQEHFAQKRAAKHVQQ